MMAADCLASYGSLARFRDIKRINNLGQHTLIGSSGDIADMQYLLKELDLEVTKELNYDDGHFPTPRHWFNFIQTTQYHRRCKMDPLWNSHIIGGVEAKTGKPFLGYVDLKGTNYQSPSIASGFGAYLAQPLLRGAVEQAEQEGRRLTEQEAIGVLERALGVLFCRDARSSNKIIMAKVSGSGVIISDPYEIQTNWSIA